MVASPVVVNIDEQRLALVLDQAAKQLESGAEEITVDFSAVRRIDASHARKLEGMAHSDKGVEIVLRGVNVDVYKTLKLLKLTNHFLFVN